MGKGYHYHVVERPFQLAELKLLVDAIQSSKFITVKKTRKLIGKLEQMVSRYEASELQRQVFVAKRIKTMNESVYYTVDVIHRAIAENRKIAFQYFQWNVKKEMELRHGGAWYQVSPWGLSWDDENYYLSPMTPGRKRSNIIVWIRCAVCGCWRSRGKGGAFPAV